MFPHLYLPNRQIILWLYTKIKLSQLEIRDRFVAIHATMEEGAFKIGALNPGSWLAYTYYGLLFIKRIEYFPVESYPDRGASSLLYCNPDVIELEILGPVVKLKPGDSVEHQEIWQIYQEDK